MNTTVKYVLIGGGIAAAVYLVAKAVAPTQPTPLQTVTSGITSVVSSIATAIKGPAKPADATATSSSSAAIARMLPNYESGGAGSYAPSAWSSYGDAAIADGAGYSRMSGRTVAASSQFVTPAQRTQYGDIPNSKFAVS